MSSLRIKTLRLCWLEAFIAVVDAENISAAARELDVDQSTVSRYMQALEKWTGKKLIDVGKVHDEDDIRISVGVTEEGREFFNTCTQIVEQLSNYRHESAVREEMVESMDYIISNMEQDRRHRVVIPVAREVEETVDKFRLLHPVLAKAAPLSVLTSRHSLLRAYFNRYEWARNRQKRVRNLPPAPPIPDEWFEGRLSQSSLDLLAALRREREAKGQRVAP